MVGVKAKTKSYCIICGEEKDGIEIKDDYVLSSIRWFKTNVTKTEKNNRLVVCKDCYPKYASMRKRYESRQALYVGLGIVFAIMSLVLAPSVTTLFMDIILILFLYALSLLTYMPKLKINTDEGRADKR